MNKKDRILASSLRLFVAQGIDATSTASIAEDANVATGLLFHHFGNKETLIKNLYIVSVKRMSKLVEDQIPPANRFSEKAFKSLWFRLVEIVQRERQTYVFLGRIAYSNYIGWDEKHVGLDILGAHKTFFENGVSKGRLKDLSLPFLLSQVFENIRFSALYILDCDSPKKEIDTMYLSVRDMIFKS